MPVTYAEFAEWISEFGIEEFEGSAGFTFEEEIEVAVQISDDQSAVLFSAELGLLGSETGPEAMRRLLQLDYLGITTGGAAISLDEDIQTLVIWQSLPLGSVGVSELTVCFDCFLAASKHGKSAVADILEQTPDEDHPAFPGGGFMSV
ncbi:MAG: type III secretion system chaperone [Hyphomicrobiales bacterium]|nr:type III secretion system chaperone [Hyphomicrobiales bacterium]